MVKPDKPKEDPDEPKVKVPVAEVKPKKPAFCEDGAEEYIPKNGPARLGEGAVVHVGVNEAASRSLSLLDENPRKLARLAADREGALPGAS